MTHPQTDNSIKKRLAHVARLQWRTPRTTPDDTIDAVLSKMHEPSTLMVLEGMKAHPTIDKGHVAAIWRAMITHIRRGGE